ncbi:NAD(P)-binding protein [Rhizodiscina lignyota]|uniref:NAD(P)-binding protein n=1 Tax=Rhizodiscina lignyota TaxID=1504668 RepID=A0A9P4ICI8_9PEZI|nr:NAD(P)-binding protein [Rhizodiscina lignyota]
MTNKTAVIIGGTGAGGIPVVRELSKHNYNVRVLTRNPDDAHSKSLTSIPNVTLYAGDIKDVEALRAAFKGAHLAFVNLNSWVLGIKNEIFWGIRIFEIAVQCGIEHYIWSSLDNFFLETKYDDDLRVGHYYGKGHVEQWMTALPQTPMKWSIITTSPYIESLWQAWHPRVLEDGTREFALPLNDGAVPFTCIEEIGYYARWVFEHPGESAGMNLKLAVEHVSLPMFAEALTQVTGIPARSKNITIEEWIQTGPFNTAQDFKMGSQSEPADDPSLLTVAQNFSAWMRLYQRSGGNKGILRRDYALLDRIYPERVKTLKEWMEKTNYKADKAKKVTMRPAWSAKY